MFSWFKSLSTVNKVMVGGIALLFLAVAILLPVAILTHEEAGLLTACDTPNGSLNYDGQCFEVKWDKEQFPLSVSIYTDNRHPPADPDDALSYVVDLINARLGFTALQKSSSPNADIRIEFEAASLVGDSWLSDASGAVLHHRGDDGNLWCEVRTWNNGTVEMVDKVLTHELGHCLGLAHDDFASSAMYYSVEPDGPVLSRLRITDHDRKLLRDLYR